MAGLFVPSSILNQEELFPFWNKRNLIPPPMTGFKIIHHTPDRISATLAGLFETILSDLKNLKVLNSDSALVYRLLYRTKKTLRNQKAYKCLQKVRRCLGSYLSLDIVSVITNARQATYSSLGPCKEALEWCLLNLLRISALFHRMQITCIEVAHHLHNHLTTGNIWHLAILFFACISRIWTISQYLVARACEWYLQLKPFLQYLTDIDSWLPAGYELPSDLKTWLGNPDYIHLYGKVDSIEKRLENSVQNIQTKTGIVFNEDLGESVTRRNIDIFEANSNKINFQNKRDIIMFLRKESNLRQSQSDCSLTQKLNEREWTYLQNELQKCIKELNSEKNKNKILQLLKQAKKKLKALIKQY